MRAAYGLTVSRQVHIGLARVTPVINARRSIRTPFIRNSAPQQNLWSDLRLDFNPQIPPKSRPSSSLSP
jgi:hypothetical protein